MPKYPLFNVTLELVRITKLFFRNGFPFRHDMTSSVTKKFPVFLEGDTYSFSEELPPDEDQLTLAFQRTASESVENSPQVAVSSQRLYKAWFHARNGRWFQYIDLRRADGHWKSKLKVYSGLDGRLLFQSADSGFPEQQARPLDTLTVEEARQNTDALHIDLPPSP